MPHDLAASVERIAEDLVLAGPDDRDGLVAVHGRLRTLSADARATGDPRLAALARQAALALERALVDADGGTSACLDRVGVYVVSMQEALRAADAAVAAAQGGPPIPAAASAVPVVLPENADDAIFAEFLSRQGGVLEEMEANILEFERDGSMAARDALRGQFHTLKGEAGLLGLVEVQGLCHDVESLLERPPAPALADPLLAVKDWLGRAFAAFAGKGRAPGPAAVVLEVVLGTGWKNDPVAAPVSAAGAAQALDKEPELYGDFINEATEHLDAVELGLLALEHAPDDIDSINAIFRAFHTVKGVAAYLDLGQIHELAHGVETLLDRARKGRLQMAGRATDVVFEAIDLMKRGIAALSAALAAGSPLAEDPDVPAFLRALASVGDGSAPPVRLVPSPDQGRKLGEILIAQGLVEPGAVKDALLRQVDDSGAERLGEILVKDEGVPARAVYDALRAQRGETEGRQIQLREAIKVDADRLDRLVDAIGELVITETMVSRTVRALDCDTAALGQLALLDKITRTLQEMSTALRLVPVRPTFQKMARLVRDLAKKSGKEIDFITEGDDTELDKSVVDRIGDPLVHLMRNAVDHGLEEDAAARRAAGKPAAGRVTLRAFHHGGGIVIEAADDGRGLDRGRIVAKALETGMIASAAGLTEREVFNLVFAPGFSTAARVTDVSGRGIGMDVVRKNVEALRGRIEIKSEAGRGTTFSIHLPLTLAIIDGMVLRVGGERYLLPLLAIRRSLRPVAGQIATVQGRGEMLRLDGDFVPLFRLGRLFGTEGAEGDAMRAIVVVVEGDGRAAALLVDELLGQQQVVIKTLGAALRDIPGISGSTILPDGHVGLILDVEGLVQLAHGNRAAGAVPETA